MSHVFLLFATIGAVLAGTATSTVVEDDTPKRRVLTLVDSDGDDDTPRVIHLRKGDKKGAAKHEALQITVRADGSGPPEITIIGPDGPIDLEDLEDLDLDIIGLGPDGVFGPKGLIDLESLEDLHFDFNLEAFTDGAFDFDMDFDWKDLQDRMPKLFQGKDGHKWFQFNADGHDDDVHVFGVGPEGEFQFDVNRFIEEMDGFQIYADDDHGVSVFGLDGKGRIVIDGEALKDGMPKFFHKGGPKQFKIHKDGEHGASMFGLDGKGRIVIDGEALKDGMPKFFRKGGPKQFKIHQDGPQRFRIKSDGNDQFFEVIPDGDQKAVEAQRRDARPRGNAELHQRIDRLERKLERILKMLERLEH